MHQIVRSTADLVFQRSLVTLFLLPFLNPFEIVAVTRGLLD